MTSEEGEKWKRRFEWMLDPANSLFPWSPNDWVAQTENGRFIDRDPDGAVDKAIASGEG